MVLDGVFVHSVHSTDVRVRLAVLYDRADLLAVAAEIARLGGEVPVRVTYWASPLSAITQRGGLPARRPAERHHRHGWHGGRGQ